MKSPDCGWKSYYTSNMWLNVVIWSIAVTFYITAFEENEKRTALVGFTAQERFIIFWTFTDGFMKKNMMNLLSLTKKQCCTEDLADCLRVCSDQYVRHFYVKLSRVMAGGGNICFPKLSAEAKKTWTRGVQAWESATSLSCRGLTHIFPNCIWGA